MNVAEAVHTDVGTIASAGILVLIVLGSLYILLGWWAGTRSAFRGDHKERTLLTADLIIASMLLIFAVASLGDAGAIGDVLSRILIRALAAVTVLSAIGALGIYWFNLPKFLVPPRARREPGRWQEIRRR